MKQRLTKLNRHLYQLLASRGFFLVIIGVFTLARLFVAAVSIYPMAFDEDFHLGIIKIYASHPLPWGLSETSAMAQYGNVPHDPSWLFHWLMSFPYTFLHFLGINETGIVFGLRLINIALFVGGILFIQKVLARTRLGNASINVILALWLLIPIMTQIAGQINYDNLVMLVFAVALWLAQGILMSIREHRPFIPPAILLLITLLTGSATKYAFLPAAIGIVIVVTISLWRHRKTLNYTLPARRPLYFVLLGFLLVVTLCANYRYVQNVVAFHSISPSCDQTFSENDCLQYGVYARDSGYRATKADDFVAKNPLNYLVSEWVPGLVFRLFFVVSGPTNGYDTRQPAIIPLIISSIIGGLALLMMIVYFRTTLNQPYVWLFLLPVVLYVGALFIQLYGSYRDTAVPVAINGRYLIPFIPLVAALAVPALRNLKRVRYSSIIASFAIVLLVFTGDGIGSYITQSRMSWFYPGPARDITNVLRDVSNPLVPTFE